MKKSKKKVPGRPKKWLTTSLVMIALICAAAQAVIFEHEILQYENRNYDDAGFEFGADITETNGGVRFEFYNNSTTPSSINKLYFENGPLDGIAYLDPGTGTAFELQASNTQFPGGNILTPAFYSAYTLDSGPLTRMNGIDPGEYTAVIFDLAADAGFEDVLEQLYEGTFRFGIHVLGGGSSTSGVNMIPEPATLILLSIGSLLFLGKKGL